MTTTQSTYYHSADSLADVGPAKSRMYSRFCLMAAIFARRGVGGGPS